MQLTSQVRSPNALRQLRERPECQDVLHAAKRPAAPQIRLGPRRKWVLAPVRKRDLVTLRQNAEAGSAEIAIGRLAVSRVQQSAEKAERFFLRAFAARRREEPAPKRPRRSLLAAAEQRPAQPAFVVLCPGKSERHQQDVPLVR